LGVGEEGLKENDAPSAAAGAMAMTWLTVFVLEPVAAVRLTVYDPAEANVWLGFWAVLVAPSPKLHDHEVGDPADVSVNCTA
jgi:hypothetical protein